jgi:hypothetical protein
VATSHDRVALVLDRLQLMPWLTDIVLNGSTRASVSNGTSTSSGDQFEITAAFSNVAGAK